MDTKLELLSRSDFPYLHLYTHIILGLIPDPESIIGELKTTQSGVKLSEEIIPGDSGYFSRTDSYSQSDYCDDTESGSEAENASESGRLQMQLLQSDL